MARIRTIKPELFTSRVVSAWPHAVRWTFAGLFTYLDDQGRGEDDARLVEAALYCRDDKTGVRKVETHLDLITKEGPLCRYSVGGIRYMHITSWGEHQRVNRPTPSKFPPCPVHEEEGLFP